MERRSILGLLLHITITGAAVRTGPSASASVRLVNGDGSCSGRVEVYHQGRWGTVCDNNWDIYDAAVVCRQLLCGKAVDIKGRAYFGAGTGEIWMSAVKCSGSEETLGQCKYRRAGTFNCGHDEDAGVVCSGSVDVRLVHGSGRCSGRVEVKRDGEWGTICTKIQYRWDQQEADVACKQLLCGNSLSHRMDAYFGEGSGKIAMTNINCYYGETAISDCTESWLKTHCDHAHDVGVVCSGAVRLVNGTDRCSGRVEVRYGGQWGTVCDEDWDLDDAEVVCRELGCGRPLGVQHRAQYGEGSGDIWMSDVKCSGAEELFSLCLHSDSATHSCVHAQDAGVFCSDSVEVRLVNGTSRCSGRVEVSYNGQWGTVCGQDWDISDAEVVCRQLRCGKALGFKSDAFFGEGSGQIWMSGVNCSGDEDSVASCRHVRAGSHSCSHDADAGVVCSDDVQVRLVGGYHPCSGRVEVSYDGRWGRVCDDDWDLKDAAVVCRQVGCGPALKALGAYFGVGAEAAFLDNVTCSGHETSLAQCVRSGFRRTDCGQHAASGVICSGPVRLVNGTNHCSGRVEVYYKDQWGTVCGDDWGMEDAEVVCRQLSCGRAKGLSYFGEGSGQIWMSGVKCSGAEESLSRCRHDRPGSHSCSHNEDAGVICSDSADVRLFGGPDPCSGRVELLYSGGMVVCEDGWDLSDAEVVCRQLGCGSALNVSHLSSKFALRSDARFSLYGVGCSGQESSISQCPHGRWDIGQCPRGSTATVTCSACGNEEDTVCSEDIKVKLTSGAGRCSGVVEVYYRGQRGRVCYGQQEYMGSTSGWRVYNGPQVVCRQLGCGPAIDVYYSDLSALDGGSLRALEIFCSGEEKNLMRCSLLGFDCSAYKYTVGVMCTSSIRLMDGSDRCSGRVEVNHGGRWGTVCDDGWDLQDAAVVCRELECGTALSAKRRAYFGPGVGEIWMNKLTCSGTEGFLKACRHRGFRRHDCGHHQDAGVICSGAVRLVNGTDRCSGRVEVYRHGRWGALCSERWDISEAQVVCRELGCGAALRHRTDHFFGEGTGEVSMSVESCEGSEESLLHCHQDRAAARSCGRHRDVGVICSESVKVRLADGPVVCAGRVEVFSEGRWGTVCDDGWDLNEADVACRELGCGPAVEVKLGAFYGAGSGDVLMTDVNCSGSEASLTGCPHSRSGKCGHHQDAGVVCAEFVRARLVNGRADGCSGRVELFSLGQWGSVATYGWGTKDSEVLCREVGCSQLQGVDYQGTFGPGSEQFGIYSVACTGEERSVTSCPHETGRSRGDWVGVICAGPVRLVGGTDGCSGRVEVYRYGEWGTVCDDGWDMKEAEVVCRQLDCGGAVYVKKSAHFGRGSGQVWMSGVECTGEEGSLTHCRHQHAGSHGCGHGRDAGLVCSRSVQVRLVNGTDRCSGRVEVYVDGRWERVDGDGWDLDGAKVVCRELGCGKALEAKNGSYFGEGGGEVGMTGVKCSGLESSLTACYHLRPETQSRRKDAGAVCAGSPEVRLVNGTSRCSGRVEVYHDSRWTPVCDDNWDLNDGRVVCRQLDCGEALTVQHEAYFGSAGDALRRAEPGCSGNESSISQCPNKDRPAYGCTYREDAGLTCSGNVRLVSGYDQCSGRVEVYHGGRWGTVCDEDWDTADSQVVCRQLGCGMTLHVKDRSYFGEGSGDVLLAGMRCSGSEDSLLHCPHDQSQPRNCSHHQDVGVICADSVKVRLVNGSDRCSGRVEVYYNGQWGAVCGDGWDVADAEVACREAVCGRAQTVGDDYGQSDGPRWLKGVECRGDESSLARCSHTGFGKHECSQTVDAAVSCSAMVRLANGGRCHGRVEVYHAGVWGTVCDLSWDMNNAAVVCRELDCGAAVSAARTYAYGSPGLSGRMWDTLGCSGHESALSQCNLRPYESKHYCTASAVECSDFVRLVGGRGRCSGKVEVYHRGQWGALCGDGLERRSAAVVCRQLGCGDVVKLYYSDPGGAAELSMNCSGQESSVRQCVVERVETGCSLNGNAAVVCSVSDSRLVDGISRCSGKVELYSAGRWTERCYSAGTREAERTSEAACRNLGCGALRRIVPNCRTKTAGVICEEEAWVRLVNGTDRCSGRVEVYHAGQWGALCDEDWGLKHAEVVCEEMSCGQPRDVYGQAFFGEGSGPIWQANARCFADDMSLIQCSLEGFNTSSCSHSQDAAVVCSEHVRLANGPDRCSGRVEIFRLGQWSTVCDFRWSLTTAGVVCRELGCGIALQAPRGSRFGPGRGPVLRDSMECSGGERSLNQCRQYSYDGPPVRCGHSHEAGVICSGTIPKPEIFARPSAEVIRGTRVDISCSFRLKEIFLGGVFTLEQTSGSFRLERESSNDTVTFIIPSVDSGHEGSYRCWYQKRFEGRDVFSPQSNTIRVNIAAP